MGAYSNIPLQVMTPIEAQTKAATLGNLLQEQQLRKAQIQEYNARTMEAQARAQQQQRAVDAAQSLGQLISTNTTSNPDGTFTTDHGAVMKGLADNGYGLEALKYDADRRADLENGAKLLQQQTATRQTQAQRLSELAGPLSIPRVNWDETDPQKKQQQISQAQIATTRAASQAAREGLIDPQHLQALQGTPYTRETEQALDQMTGQGMNAAAQFKQIGDHIEDVHKKIMDAALERKAGAEATKEELGVTSQITSAMAAPATTLGGAVARVASQQPAAATATSPLPQPPVQAPAQAAPITVPVAAQQQNAAAPSQAPTQIQPTASTSARPLYMAPGPSKGLVKPGNIDLTQLAPIQNPDGSWSTVNSTSFVDERSGSPNYGKEVLVRGILNGQKVDPDDPAILQQLKDQYYKDGKNLGVFKDGDTADVYAQRLHSDWEGGKIPGVQMSTSDQNAPPPDQSVTQHAPGWTQAKQDSLDYFRSLLPKALQSGLQQEWTPQADAIMAKAGLNPEQQFQAGKIKPQSETAIQNKEDFQNIIQKIAATLPIAATTDSRILGASIKASTALSQDEKNKALAYLAANPTPATAGTAGVIRMEQLGATREYPVINKSTGQLEMRSAADINSLKGNFAPAGQGAAAMSKEAIFGDLHYNIDSARKALSALPSLDTGTRAALSYALRGTDPRSSIQTFLTGSLGTNMNPQQQEAVQSLALLAENAMTLRSVAGMGQGSDELRAAILNTIPSGKSPTKDYALGQLNRFEQVVKRLESGVPGMGEVGERQRQAGGGGNGSAQGGYIVGRRYGNLTYQGGDPNQQTNWK